jgi:hypothetical protein
MSVRLGGNVYSYISLVGDDTADVLILFPSLFILVMDDANLTATSTFVSATNTISAKTSPYLVLLLLLQ